MGLIRRGKERRDGKKLTDRRITNDMGENKERGFRIICKRVGGESRWRRTARFKLANEINGGEVNIKKDRKKRVRRLCGGAEEFWEHV